MKIILQGAHLKDNLDSVGTMNINMMEICFAIQGGFFLHLISTFLPRACVFEDFMKHNYQIKLFFYIVTLKAFSN